MKSFYLLLFTLYMSAFLSAQLCNFDISGWSYSVDPSSTGVYSLQSGSPFAPAGYRYGVDGSVALTSSSGSTILNFAPVYNDASPVSFLSFRLAAYGLSGSGRGMDLGSDYVIVRMRTPGSAFVDVLKIKGRSNALWGMSDMGSDVIAKAGSYLEYSPFEGGHLTYTAPGQLVVCDLPVNDSIYWQIELYSDRSNEVWSIDDVSFVQPAYWTNGAGNGNPQDLANWSNNAVPDSSSVLYISDTAMIPALSNLVVKGVVTSGADSIKVLNTGLQTGGLTHLQGALVLDSSFVLSEQLGRGVLNMLGGTVSGEMSMVHLPHNVTGWRHLASPLKTRWSDVASDVSNVIFGSTGSSIYAWDAINCSWYTLASGNSLTKHLPVVLYGGTPFIDSSDVMRISGEIQSEVDTVGLQYGVPNSNSPFTSTAGNEGWNFVANPFPFALNLDEVLTDPSLSSKVAPTVYLWSPKEDRYRSYNPTSGGVNGGTPVLAPWQGFWIQLDQAVTGMEPFYLKPSQIANGGGEEQRKAPIVQHTFSWQSGADSEELKVVDMIGASVDWEYKHDHKYRNADSLYAAFTTTKQGVEMELALKVLDPKDRGGIPLVFHSEDNRVIQLVYEEAISDWWVEDVQLKQWTNLRKGGLKILVSPGKPYVLKLWRERPLHLLEEKSECCDYPKMMDGLIYNTSQLEWKLYDFKGVLLLTIAPGEMAKIPELRQFYIWRSGLCYQKLYLEGR